MQYLYWLLGISIRKIANFSFSPFAWHVKLDRGESKDVLLSLPEKQPQAYEKNRLYWLLRASVRKIINFVFRHPVFLCLMVLIFKVAGKCFKSFGFAFLMLRRFRTVEY